MRLLHETRPASPNHNFPVGGGGGGVNSASGKEQPGKIHRIQRRRNYNSEKINLERESRGRERDKVRTAAAQRTPKTRIGRGEGGGRWAALETSSGLAELAV
jgi:hypothetical protein